MTMPSLPPAAAELLAHGLAAAARGLSAFAGLPAAVAVEEVVLAPPGQVALPAGDPEEPVVGIYVGFAGDLRGHCLLVLDAAGAARLAGRLLAGAAAPAELADSALQEFGNIAVSGVVNAIADRGGWRIRVSPPALARDALACLVHTVLAAASLERPEVLAVRGRLKVGALELCGTILLLPDPESLQALLAPPPASAHPAP